MNELISKLSTMTIDEVAEVAAKMFNDSRDEAGVILEAALAVLESKMSEEAFVRFCDKF